MIDPKDNNSVTWSDNFIGGVRVSDTLYLIAPLFLLLLFIYAIADEYSRNNRWIILAVFGFCIAVSSVFLFQTLKGYLSTPRKIGISTSGIHASYIHTRFRIHDEFIPWERIVVVKPFFFERIYSLGYLHSKDKEKFFVPIAPEIAHRILKSRSNIRQDEKNQTFY